MVEADIRNLSATEERALSFFIDPENSLLDYRQFVGELIRILAGDEGFNNDLRKIMDLIVEKVEKARRFNSTYLGHMLSESCIPAMIGAILAMRLGSNTVAREVSFKESALEPQALRGLMEIVGYDPEKASGTFTSGGTLANLTALTVARKLMEEQYEQQGLVAGKMRVLTIPQAHYSIAKAVNLLGGPSHLIEMIEIATEGMKMSVVDLEKKIKQSREEGIPIMAIIAIAGETETGLVDPLKEIADVAERNGIFTIADGAYGASYRLSRKGYLLEALNRFDAVTLDPHKTLYTPYPNGAVLFRNAEAHARLGMGIKAPYIQFVENLTQIIENLHKGEGSLGQKRLEGSMGAGAILSTLAVLLTLGKEGLAAIYNRTLDRVNYLYQRLQKSSYLKPVHEPDLNLLCFELREEIEKDLGIQNNQQRRDFIDTSRYLLDCNCEGEGGYFFSSTDLTGDDGQKHYVWRACLMHPRTTDEIVEAAVTGLEEIIREKLNSVS